MSRPPQPPTGSLEIFEQPNELFARAANAFCHAVDHSEGERFCVALSGGSTPRRLYQLLAERDLPWGKIHWFWGDERNVPHDHQESNARMVREALLDHVPVAETQIHPVPVDTDHPTSAAAAYERTLREYFGAGALPCWDLVLLGMGDDGHTASLFPETDALEETERWFVSNWVDKFATWRYTLTPPAINSGRRKWFLVAGSGKRPALARVWSQPHDPRKFPSQLIRPTHWFVTSDTMPDAAGS